MSLCPTGSWHPYTKTRRKHDNMETSASQFRLVATLHQPTPMTTSSVQVSNSTLAPQGTAPQSPLSLRGPGDREGPALTSAFSWRFFPQDRPQAQPSPVALLVGSPGTVPSSDTGVQTRSTCVPMAHSRPHPVVSKPHPPCRPVVARSTTQVRPVKTLRGA